MKIPTLKRNGNGVNSIFFDPVGKNRDKLCQLCGKVWVKLRQVWGKVRVKL